MLGYESPNLIVTALIRNVAKLKKVFDQCRTFGGVGGSRGGDAALFREEDDMAVVAGRGGDGLGDLLAALPPLPPAPPPPPSWLRLERVAAVD